jgi:arabinan endo-1,5-alpha-L-arabinosidase
MNFARKILVLVAVVCGPSVLADGTAAAAWQSAATRSVRAHDPSTIVKCKDDYWVFCTGRGLPSYQSKDLRLWASGPRTITNAPPWAAEAVPENSGHDFWAPDVMFVGGRYLLYFSVSTWGKNTSAIGLATNPTLDPTDPSYHWTDRGIVVQSRATNDFNTIDPAVCQDSQGKLWLAFGSFWTGIKLIELNPPTGLRIAPDSPVYSLAHNDKIEASYIYPHDGFYYLFVNWGQCCLGVRSTYNIRVGRSAVITGPYLDKAGTDMMLRGGTLFLSTQGNFIGPGHAGIVSEGSTNWFSCHFYDGTREGHPTLGLLPLRWDADGWPDADIAH